MDRRGGLPHLPSVVVLHLPASRELQLLVGEHVEEGDEVAVVLVALEVVRVPAHLADHVLQAGVARKHAVGTLGGDSREVRSSERDGRRSQEHLFDQSQRPPALQELTWFFLKGNSGIFGPFSLNTTSDLWISKEKCLQMVTLRLKGIVRNF